MDEIRRLKERLNISFTEMQYLARFRTEKVNYIIESGPRLT